jgi:hypothetical protein
VHDRLGRDLPDLCIPRGGGRKADASPEQHARYRQQRRLGAFAGLAFIALGVGRVIWSWPALTAKSHAEGQGDQPPWQTVTTTDGALSVKMPAEPKVFKQEYRGDLGLTSHIRQMASIESGKIVLSLSEKHFLDTEMQFDTPQYLESVAEATIAQTGGKATLSKAIRRGELTGREITIGGVKDHTVTTQILVSERSLYQLNVVTPVGMSDSPLIREFLDSLSVNARRLRTGDKPPVFLREQSKKAN